MGRYIKENKNTLIVLVICILIFASAFVLYHLPLAAVAYPSSICFALISISLIVEYVKSRTKHKDLERACDSPEGMMQYLDKYKSLTDEDYQRIINMLINKAMDEQNVSREKTNDMIDYYTTWVHQIKTPIASMRLILDGEDSPVSRQLADDLFRIEQYVNMVLTYVKLDYSGIDYVFKEHRLDTVIKSTLRKFAGQFIKKGLKLEYTPTDKVVVTDEKWLSFVIEQILSNAIKYTKQGNISIYMEGNSLCIKDTGIGIEKSDIPRICEKGYTGYNGRSDRRASGIGLYMSNRILKNIGHELLIESRVGQGTCVKIVFHRM